MESKCPMVFFAWATPIEKRSANGLADPMEFFDKLPRPPQTDAVYTFLDEDGTVMPTPQYTDACLPPYCYVQYTEEYPPPPPPGYRYLKSELQRDMRSAQYQMYHEVGTLRYGVDTHNAMHFAPFALTENQRSGMVSGLLEFPEGYFSTESGKLITNFTIELHGLVRIYEMHGQSGERLEYSVKAQNSYQAYHQEVEVEDLDKLPERIRAKIAGCIINIKTPRADDQVVFHLRCQLSHIPHRDQYDYSGWTKIAGQWVYGQKDTELPHCGARFHTNFKIACNPAFMPQDAMRSAMRMLELSDNQSVIVPMVLYAHLGVLFTLFEHAGFPPRMLLFVNGKTGSFKTAVCIVLFNLSGDPNNNIPATFRDTVASVEAKFSSFVDMTLLLDDYAPAATSSSRADMNKLLEAVIRYYGDGKGRGRSNAKVTQSTTLVPHGLCCITGEDSGGSQSSLLRCVLIDVDNGTFKSDVLTWFQNDTRRWTSHFQHFLNYVAQNFEHFSQLIRQSFPSRRERLRGVLKAGRIVDSAVFLSLTGELLRAYGQAVGCFTVEESGQLAMQWDTAIIQALMKSEAVSSEMDPVRFYISTLFEAVDSEAEQIARDKETFLMDTSVLGYVSNGTWHVWPDRVYGLVTKRCQLQQRIFPLSITKIHAALAEAGLIETSEEKHGGKIQVNYVKRESFGERPRMLAIRKDAAQQYLDS